MVIDEPLVRRLLSDLPEPYRDLATAPLRPVAQGWDNAVWRVGTQHALRLPVRAQAGPLIDQEARWLPEISAPLRERGIRVPMPVYRGSPTDSPPPRAAGLVEGADQATVGTAYPFPWLLVEWVPGVVLTRVPVAQRRPVAAALAAGLPALHRRAPSDAPVNPWRGVSLAARRPYTAAHARAARAHLGGHTVRGLVRLVEAAEASPPWPHPPVWCHGDLHDGNLNLDGDVLGILDFGDLTSGDPAVDLRVLWLALDTEQRDECLQVWAAAGVEGRYGPAIWNRAKGWAASFALAVAGDDQGRAEYASAIEYACTQLGV